MSKMKKIVQTLTQSQKDVICHRIQGATFKYTADNMSLSPERIRQIETKVMLKIKEILNEEEDKYPW